jgi:catechol 2,3-dioxygenase-like lactoylglutathione lyase family enzyme
VGQIFSELAEAKAFYQDVFGLTPELEDNTSVSFVMGEVVIILLNQAGAEELIAPVPVANPAAGARMCFTIGVDDVDAVCAELADRGVKVLAGPMDRRWGRRTAYFADPGGHIYEVAARLAGAS